MSAKPTALSPATAGRQFFSRKRAIVFIDGSNWYFKLKRLLAPAGEKPRTDFDVKSFALELVSPAECVDVRYYIGKLRRKRGDEKSEELYAKQQQLIAFLQRQQVHIGYGHLLAYPDGVFHEKGVDVLLAVEMIRLAVQDKYDVAYLLSSDTDILPAVKECQQLGKAVVYVGSSIHGQSFGLTKICNRTILLQTKDVVKHVPPDAPPSGKLDQRRGTRERRIVTHPPKGHVTERRSAHQRSSPPLHRARQQPSHMRGRSRNNRHRPRARSRGSRPDRSSRDRSQGSARG